MGGAPRPPSSGSKLAPTSVAPLGVLVVSDGGVLVVGGVLGTEAGAHVPGSPSLTSLGSMRMATGSRERQSISRPSARSKGKGGGVTK